MIRCELPKLKTTPDVSFAIQQTDGSAMAEKLCAFFDEGAPLLGPIGKLSGTAFQGDVWNQIQQIPYGETLTYKGLAERVGRPRAFRAVANACGKNPVPLFIPCHRVVACCGGQGGFSSGIPWKTLLLNLEQGVPLQANETCIPDSATLSKPQSVNKLKGSMK